MGFIQRTLPVFELREPSLRAQRRAEWPSSAPEAEVARHMQYTAAFDIESASKPAHPGNAMLSHIGEPRLDIHDDRNVSFWYESNKHLRILC